MESFFERLRPLEGLVRIILKDAELSARLTFRGEPPGEVRLDYGTWPAKIETGVGRPSGRIQVTIAQEVMHRVLLGEMHPGEALGRRELLLRGSAADLARFIPLLGFAPLLYREHLADLGLEGHARPGAVVAPYPTEVGLMDTARFRGDPIPLRSLGLGERAIFRMIEEAAFAAGYGVGLLRHRYLGNLSLFDVLGALSRGVEAASAAVGQGTEPGRRSST
jgi:hypothetical protein